MGCGVQQVLAGWVVCVAVVALTGCAVGGDPEASATLGVPIGETDDDDDDDDDDTQSSTTTGGADGASGDADGTSSSTGGSTSGIPPLDTGCDEVFWYLDFDGDGHGDPDSPMLACEAPPDHVDTLDDCDDNDPDNAPSLDETCDGQDNDCDALVDELSPMNTTCNGCTLAMDGDHAYAFCPTPADFDGGRTACMAFGGDLVKVDGAAEIAFITGSDVPPSGGVGGYFIGANDRDAEGQFVWADGTAVVFTNWGEGEPNDAGGAEDCVEMSVASGIWNDVPCDDRAFICEAPVR